MIQKERAIEILKILNNRKVVSIKELCQELFASKSTIRRDLMELEKEKLVRRTRGGVTLIKKENTEFTEDIRETINIFEKNYISILAKSYIKDDITIFLDSSSTVRTLTKHLYGYNNIRIITNGISIAKNLAKFNNITTYVCPGKLKGLTSSLIGDETCRFINQFNADISFISCKYIDENYIYESDPEQARPKRYMIENSKQVIVLADHTKFNRKSLFKTASIKNIDVIITDKKPSNEFISSVENTSIIFQ